MHQPCLLVKILLQGVKMGGRERCLRHRAQNAVLYMLRGEGLRARGIALLLRAADTGLHQPGIAASYFNS